MSTLRDRETSLIVSVQRWPPARLFVPVAQGMSLFGEHAAGWIGLGVLGAVVDEPRRLAWVIAVLAIIVAHGLSIVIKRLVRRPRPGVQRPTDGGAGSLSGSYTRGGAGPVTVYAHAPSKLSFPSSHASSTMAAAVVFTALLPFLWPVAVLVVLLMGFSRISLGMHFPTDVLAGFAIGLVVGLPTALLTA